MIIKIDLMWLLATFMLSLYSAAWIFAAAEALKNQSYGFFTAAVLFVLFDVGFALMCAQKMILNALTS